MQDDEWGCLLERGLPGWWGGDKTNPPTSSKPAHVGTTHVKSPSTPDYLSLICVTRHVSEIRPSYSTASCELSHVREAAARESRIRGIIAVGGRERLCKGRNVRRATYIEPTLVIVKHHKVWKFNFEFQFKRNQVENSVSGQGRSKCLVLNISCLGQPTDIHTHTRHPKSNCSRRQ